MNSPHSIETIVPEIAAATPTVKDCEKELYCGFPYLMPVTTFLWYILELVIFITLFEYKTFELRGLIL